MIPTFSLPKAGAAQDYLDAALQQGSKRAVAVRGGLDKTMKARNQELDRFRAVKTSLVGSLSKLHDAYPSFDHLSEFTKQLFSLDLDIGRVKQALGGLNHALTMIKALTREYLDGVKHCRSVDQVVKTRSAYIGRVSSVMRQLQKHLEILNQARDVFRNLPTIDDGLFTVAIAGFPNVGKSTLLSKLTTAKPEIKPYAFTTKGLNVGYFEYKYNKIQCIDTPGTLNRKNPNPIEQKADITIKYLSHVIVYVFDPTESSYSLEDQQKLYEKTVELGKPVLVYISKTDLADAQKILNFLPLALTEPAKLRTELVAKFKQEFM